MYIGLWGLEEPLLVSGLDRRSLLVFVALLRCGQIPSASQLGWLGLLRHGADIGQTQLRLSLLRRESRSNGPHRCIRCRRRDKRR